MTFKSRRAAAIAGALMMALAGSSPVRADVKDYEFQLVDQQLKKGDAVIAVRLVHKPTGRAIPDAVIFATRLDMSPDKMEGMTAPLEPIASDAPGVYRFKSNLTMEGAWALSLSAKVQGEPETLQSRLIIKALP